MKKSSLLKRILAVVLSVVSLCIVPLTSSATHQWYAYKTSEEFGYRMTASLTADILGSSHETCYSRAVTRKDKINDNAGCMRLNCKHYRKKTDGTYELIRWVYRQSSGTDYLNLGNDPCITSTSGVKEYTAQAFLQVPDSDLTATYFVSTFCTKTVTQIIEENAN